MSIKPQITGNNWMQDFLLKERLNKVTNKLGLNWEELEDFRKKMLSELASKEPEESFMRKAIAANTLYDHLGNQENWRQILEITNWLQAWVEADDLKNVLNSQNAQNVLMWTKGVKAAMDAVKVFKKANIVNQAFHLKNTLPETVSDNSTSHSNNSTWSSQNIEETRITEITETSKLKVDFKARWKIEIKKTKSDKQREKEAYAKAAEEVQKKAQEHLAEKFAEVNMVEAKNQRNQRKARKEWKTKEMAKKFIKEKIIAASLSGAGIGAGVGWAMFF